MEDAQIFTYCNQINDIQSATNNTLQRRKCVGRVMCKSEKCKSSFLHAMFDFRGHDQGQGSDKCQISQRGGENMLVIIEYSIVDLSPL